MSAVRQSFARARAAGFAARFYEIFLASDPAVRRKFERTDFTTQRGLLVHGIFSMLDYTEGKGMGKLAIARLAQSHGPRGLDIPSPMFEQWLVACLAALASTDPSWEKALEAEWRSALRPALDAMIAPHRKERGGARR